MGWAAESHAPGSGFLTPAHLALLAALSTGNHVIPVRRPLKTTPLHTHTIPTSSFPFLRLPPEAAFGSSLNPTYKCSWKEYQEDAETLNCRYERRKFDFVICWSWSWRNTRDARVEILEGRQKVEVSVQKQRSRCRTPSLTR